MAAVQVAGEALDICPAGLEQTQVVLVTPARILQRWEYAVEDFTKLENAVHFLASHPGIVQPQLQGRSRAARMRRPSPSR